jgi:hypothetical protein
LRAAISPVRTGFEEVQGGTWSTVAEITGERPKYIALLREAKGNERAVSFESLTGKEAAVGDEITVEGVHWRILAVEPEEPPWAGTLVCERAGDVITSSEPPSRLEDDLPLHLRVLRAIVEGEPTQERIDQALALANEVYELEENDEFEE